MRSDSDFDTWFLLRLAEFVLRCRGVDFTWRNSAPVLEDRYELVKINRASARALDSWQSRSLSVLRGGRAYTDGRGKVDVCQRKRKTWVA